MPSFEQFRHLHLFSAPATKQSVYYDGTQTGAGFSNTTITDSILNTAELSVPFWWLLHKISFSVQWSAVLPSPTGQISDSFTAEFTFNESPNDKICRTYLSDTFTNLLNTTNPNTAEFTNPPSRPESINNYFLVGTMEAFQCDKVHAAFQVYGEEVAASASFIWYITSAERKDWAISYGDNYREVFQDTFTINLPNGQEVELNAFCDFFDADYGPNISEQSTMTLENVEWFEL